MSIADMAGIGSLAQWRIGYRSGQIRRGDVTVRSTHLAWLLPDVSERPHFQRRQSLFPLTVE